VFPICFSAKIDSLAGCYAPVRLNSELTAFKLPCRLGIGQAGCCGPDRRFPLVCVITLGDILDLVIAVALSRPAG
jgi:hypothetical protein